MKNVHLEYLLDFLRFASISADPAYRSAVGNCAEWLNQRLNEWGLQSNLHSTDGFPVILAKNEHRPGRKTVLIYGHYDVQPVDPLDLWHHPPFEPYVADGLVTARGATDNKGQILSHILGVKEVLAQKKELPVNVIFLIEGEEEISSPHLAPFVEKHRSELACDVVVVSDNAMVGAGQPSFTYGLRGLTILEAHLTGPARDLHSGMFGGAVENPVTVLARLISGLHDSNGKVAVEGFYDHVCPIQDWERRAWSKLSFNDEEIRKVSGAPQLAPEKGYTPLECIWARPTAEVNGLYGGYQGPGSKTVLPKEAHAKLSFRLVPDQDPNEIAICVEKYLKKFCPPSVKLHIQRDHGGKPYLMDPHSSLGQAAQKALGRAFHGRAPALIREGGTIPVVADFKRILGVDTLLLGLALPDCGAHSPNETFPIENLEYGMQLNQYLLEEIAK